MACAVLKLVKYDNGCDVTDEQNHQLDYSFYEHIIFPNLICKWKNRKLGFVIEL